MGNSPATTATANTATPTPVDTALDTLVRELLTFFYLKIISGHFAPWANSDFDSFQNRLSLISLSQARCLELANNLTSTTETAKNVKTDKPSSDSAKSATASMWFIFPISQSLLILQI